MQSGGGRGCCSEPPPPPPGRPRCGQCQPPWADAETCCNQQARPRVPLAASGGVGGRARGRGRLADAAAANWWADPESPRKRGRLSAVRQARLCGSGSPLLQRSPWQEPECLGAAQPSTARRQLQPRGPSPPPAFSAAPLPSTPRDLRSRASHRARFDL